MKKFFALFILTLIMAFQPAAHADYPQYLNGDPDYILTDGQMGTGFYMKKSSLNVEQYSPPLYIISVSVYFVNNADRGNTTYNKVQTLRFRYDWDRRAMHVQSNDGGWRYLDPNGSRSQTMLSLPTGELAFYVAYRKKFYGNFSDSFYWQAD
ncbi:MAG: hypothetical protein IJL14_02025 [Selenomonadaceae bacterium]|nr:hypothetical protein [Selenomonadaceae bacterium]